LIGAAPHKGAVATAAAGPASLWTQVLFVVGGVTGVAASSSATDLVLHDTYFVVGHFHWVMAAPGLLVGLHLAELTAAWVWVGFG
jgi:cytochrome c oxidase subunit 1